MVIILFSVKRTGFEKGEKAPFAHHDVFVYPKDWEPYGFNYKGNGLLYGAFALVSFGK